MRDARFSKPARRAWPVDLPDWCPRQDSHLHWRRSRRRVSALDYAGEKIGAPGQGCTGTARILSPLPLLLGYGSGRSADSHVRKNLIARKRIRRWCDEHADSAVRAPMKWCRVKDSNLQPSRSERDASPNWANPALLSRRPRVEGRGPDKARWRSGLRLSALDQRMVLPAGISPATSAFEARRSGA